MRTFHVGGTASTSAEGNKVSFKHSIYVEAINGNTVFREADPAEKLEPAVLFTRKGSIVYRNVIDNFDIPAGAQLLVADGDKVAGKQEIFSGAFANPHGGFVRLDGSKVYVLGPVERVNARTGAELKIAGPGYVEANEAIITFDPFSEPIISEFDGMIRFKDLVLGTTLVKEVNEETGTIGYRVTDHVLESTEPALVICNEDGNPYEENGKVVSEYLLPGSSYILVQEGQLVKKGHTIAKLLTAGAKTKDITGGLPRVGELFEARRPRNVAVLAAVSGEVIFGKIVKGKREILVKDEYGKLHKHMILLGKHILVRDGDHVDAGERLCDGNYNPHDILSINGENALQQFLLDEVQEVYRLQGVDINDKHLGIVVRQMLRKVVIVRVGDTSFIQDQRVDKFRFHEENRKVIAGGGQPAVARPCLLGITHASLSIDSFVSAASFQETTRVLTNAAIAGSRDELRGLKENVIIGHLIPAGTGMKCYRDVKLKNEDMYRLEDAEKAKAEDNFAEDLVPEMSFVEDDNSDADYMDEED